MIPKAKNLIFQLRRSVEELEQDRGHLSDANLMLSELSTQIQLCENLVHQERREAQAQWRHKLEELSFQRDFIDKELGKFQRRRGAAAQHERDRLEQLKRREQMPSFMAEAYAEEGSSIQRSSNMVDGIIDGARAQFGMLREQRETIKNAQRAAFDILNRLGVSQSLMRAVEQRDKQDLVIVVFGMVAVLGLLYFLLG